MQEEGYIIPELPVVYIKAKDEADAKEILLKISSHYGKVTQKGFEDFIKGLDIDFEELGLDIKPPQDIKEELGLLPETPRTAVTRPGDIYTIGAHRLICGDSTKEETYKRLLGDERADLIFTDPPYGVGLEVKYKKRKESTSWHSNGVRPSDKIDGDEGEIETMLEQAFGIMSEYMKDNASYYITAPQGRNHMIFYETLEKAGIPVKHMVIWCKNHPVMGSLGLDYHYQHEPILYGWKKNHNFYGMGKYKTSLWHYKRPEKSDLHPTMKPPELIKNAIENSMEPLEKAENALQNSTVKNNIILDPFAGSGSTLIAAEDCKRHSRLIELDPHYCDVIVTRALQAYPSLKATVERKGKTKEITLMDFQDVIKTKKV
jgi:DNA modification methylase